MMIAAMATLTAITVPAPVHSGPRTAGVIVRFLFHTPDVASEELPVVHFAAPREQRRQALLRWTQPTHGNPHHRL